MTRLNDTASRAERLSRSFNSLLEAWDGLSDVQKRQIVEELREEWGDVSTMIRSWRAVLGMNGIGLVEDETED